MDNDNQVKKSLLTRAETVQKEIVALKDEFLSEGEQFIQSPARETRHYNLEEEFAKTRKNVPVRTYVFTAGFIVFVLVSALLLTLYINWRSSRLVKLDFKEFEDINLKELLDVATQLQEERRQLEQQLIDLEFERDRLIQDVDQNRDIDISIINENRSLSTAEKNRQIAAINKDTDLKIKVIIDEYSDKIENIKRQIALINEKLAQYDSREVEMAEQQKEMLNSQAKVFEREKQELETYYQSKIESVERDYQNQIDALNSRLGSMQRTMRTSSAQELEATEDYLLALYNPVFSEEDTSPEVLAILSELAVEASAAKLAAYREILQTEKVVSQAIFNDIRRQIREVSLLMGRLSEIPYYGDVPRALSKMSERSNQIINGYEELWNTLADRTEEKNQIISEKDQVIDENLADISLKASIIAEQSEVISTKDGQIKNLDKQIKEKETALTSYKSDIAALDGQIADLESTITIGRGILEDQRKELEILGTEIEEKKLLIHWYNNFFEAVRLANRETGFIIDKINSNSVLVYLNPAIDIEKGDMGIILRDNQFIGKIIFNNAGFGTLIADLEKGTNADQIKAFDKLLIEKE